MSDVEIEIRPMAGPPILLHVSDVAQVICRSTDDDVQFHVEQLPTRRETA